MTWNTMLTTVAPVGRAGQEPWFVVLFTGTMVVAAAAFVARSIVQRRVWPLAAAVAVAAGLTAAAQWIPALLAADDVHYRLSWDHFLAGVIVALIVLLPPGLMVWSFVRFIARRIGPRRSQVLGRRGLMPDEVVPDEVLRAERQLSSSWSLGSLRPWLKIVAERELPAGLRGRVEASDIVQQTLLDAWRGLGGFRGKTQAERLAWLRMILRRVVLQEGRSRFGTQKRGGERLQSELAFDRLAH